MIFDTNLRTAHAAGRWKQIQRTKAARPYLRYSAIGDARTRPAHRAWDGTIRHVDDPVWRTHYPPNDWRCRCSVRTLSVREMAREGLSETPADKVPAGNAGIGAGWDYNVGIAAWGRAISEKAIEAERAASGQGRWEALTAGNWRTAGRPERLPTRPARAAPGVETKDRASMLGAVRAAIGGEEATFSMPDGQPLHVVAETLGQHLALNRGRLIPLLRETIEEPTEIWQGFYRDRVTGKVVLRRHLIATMRVDKDRTLHLVLNATKGRFAAWTFFPTNRWGEVSKLRKGALVFWEGADRKADGAN